MTTRTEHGVPWAGSIPAHWTVTRFHNALRRIRRHDDNDLPPGAISFGKVVLKDSERLTQETLDTYQTVFAGEFLINPINLNYDLKSLRTALSAVDARVSPAYIVAAARSGWSPKYLSYLLHCFDLLEMKTLGAGVRQTITFADIAKSKALRPPITEQIAIAAHIDNATASIDKQRVLLERKKALLQEQRKAAIHDAVTKGLDRNAPMKASGCGWIDCIPSAWKVKRVKDVSLQKPTNGVGEAADWDDPQLPRYVRITDILSPTKLRSDTFRSLPRDVAAKAMLRQQDILLASVGASFGKSYLHTASGEHCFAGFLTRVRLNSGRVLPKYFIYWTETATYWDQLASGVLQSTIQNFSASKFANLWLPVPPLDVQSNIVAHLDAVTGQLDQQCELVQKKIDLLGELRASIIHEAVTKGVPSL